MEIVTPRPADQDYRAVIFDFDGTLSLFRRNWQDVMIPMMVGILEEQKSGESRETLHQIVEDFVMRLNGRQTIYQMIQLAEEVRSRGGAPREPLEYKHQYHELLWKQVASRVESVKAGRVAPEEMTVPGAHVLLNALRDRGLTLYLASGTDIGYVKDELAALQLASYFEDRVYGALDDYKKFSKAMIIQQIVGETGFDANQLLGFGDGFVEIEEVRKAGGYAVGVASNEETREGVNAWKRERLIRAGADVIIADYRERETLLTHLGLS